MAISSQGSAGRPVATLCLGSMALWVWGPWPMSLPGGPILWNLGKGSHAPPDLSQWRQGCMVITKVCCLCPLEGQPLRPMLHWGSTRVSSGVLEECGTDYRDQSSTCEWHHTAGTKVSQVLVVPSLNHSAPQALALRACDGSGSSVDLWIPFGGCSSLPWRIVPGFWSDGWSILISLSVTWPRP